MPLTDPPEDLDAFLCWLKERTEAAWANLQTKTLEDYKATRTLGPSWKNGTKWQPGLESRQIDALEERWQLRFPADYRRFLGLLNAPDRPMVCTAWRGNTLLLRDDHPSFYDWQRDEAALIRAREWPLQGILFDVEQNGLWRGSWGPKPRENEVRQALTRLIAASPKLIPVFGHRYILEETSGVGSPVLSVYQSDVIIYGVNLREYLLAEFGDLLGLRREQVDSLRQTEIDEESLAAIPFWGEFLFEDG